MTTTIGSALPHQVGVIALPEQSAEGDRYPKHAFPLAELMSAWDIGTWRRLRWLSAGKNEHARVVTDRGTFFLRRSYRLKTRPALDFQIDLLRALRAHGFPAPVPVPARDGSCIVVIELEASAERAAHDRMYTVTEALPGTAYDGTDPDLLATMGRTLARFHNSVGGFGLANVPELDDLLAGVREKLEIMDAAVAPDLHARGSAIVAELGELWRRLPLTVMHGGFRRGSLLFAEGEVCGFLDVDSARLGPRAQDLATALHDIGKVYTERGRDDHKVALDLDKIAMFLDGYREVAPISPAEADAIVLMIEAKRVKRAMGRAQRLDAGECLSAADLDKIEMERARLAWLEDHLPALRAVCAGRPA